MLTRCEIFNEDCIPGLERRVLDGSVHLSVTSIPFEALFAYSGLTEDLSNNASENDIRAGRFALNLRFVVAQLLRVHAPGTLCCIHVQQLIAFKNQHSFMGRRDFRGAVIDVFGAGGFRFAGEFCIAKDPQRAAKNMDLHSLQFKSGYARSSTIWAPWVNDYVLIFAAPGEIAVPVRPLKHKVNPGGWYTSAEWIRDACGVWSDILEIDVLDPMIQLPDGKKKDLKEAAHERHACPLQLEVIRRLVTIYSNPISIQPDVLVLDPFMGIGSTAWVCLGAPSPVTKLALAEPRNVIGFELKASYHQAALANVERARKRHARKQKAESLF